MLPVSLEKSFDASFIARLALREKQIQQSYRPVIGIHKWFARRPGSVFRGLLLAEFNGTESLKTTYFSTHNFKGVIADPFMGGGTPIIEANRLGFDVVGADVNPMAYWIVRQALIPFNLSEFTETGCSVISKVEKELGDLYVTECLKCRMPALVKYFLWVKTAPCPQCDTVNDLFPGYLLAEAERHPSHVIACRHCGALNEYDRIPKAASPGHCRICGKATQIEGTIQRQTVECRKCERPFDYTKSLSTPPAHRMWGIEYHCHQCKPSHKGRFFKSPDVSDLQRFKTAEQMFRTRTKLPIPTDEIPKGDETRRLHRWQYQRYRDMFNDRQLLGLGILFKTISKIGKTETRNALLTVFSDFIRYQNMLCRYDTYALKCQDIFSVHGYPVGLVQCENNLLGIPRVGSGGFIHFVQKYTRAKQYCDKPFETEVRGKSRRKIYIRGEQIAATFSKTIPSGAGRTAHFIAGSAEEVQLHPNTLDGVFTDPPYFDNVQYAELMDFCFAWLRQGLSAQHGQFSKQTTRSEYELTGNITLGKDLEHFACGLSRIFRHYSRALKPCAPFVFTYHHNSAEAYSPIVVAVLDAGLNCTATLPVPAEMGASLHIARTDSSVLDSVFVCRNGAVTIRTTDLEKALLDDSVNMKRGGVRITRGDLRCLAAGHLARKAINRLHSGWRHNVAISKKLTLATETLAHIAAKHGVERIIEKVFLKEGA